MSQPGHPNPTTTPATGNLQRTVYDLTQDEWRHLCQAAFENLPTNTTITMTDIDAILTWCLPIYHDIIGDSI